MLQLLMYKFVDVFFLNTLPKLTFLYIPKLTFLYIQGPPLYQMVKFPSWKASSMIK